MSPTVPPNRSAACLPLILLVAAAAAQSAPPPQASPIDMPADRAADSYAIYAQLLPGRQIEWGGAPRSFWLLSDTTDAQPLSNPCLDSGGMNPHEAIKAPLLKKVAFAQVLEDFDRTCHDRYKLDAAQLHLALPIHLLDEQGRKRYQDHVSGFIPPANDVMQAPPTPEEFRGAAGLHSFTAVYFNQAHTLAMTEMAMYCGGLCGNWSWVVLEKQNGHWKTLPWVVMSAIS